MDGSIRLTHQQRKALLGVYRSGSNPSVIHRAHVLLLLDDGISYRGIRAFLYVSFDFIRDCVERFRQGDLPGVKPVTPRPAPDWLIRIRHWLSHKSPEDFGYFRTRWSCET